MLNYGTKLDNDETSAGVVEAKEYNSLMEESKGAVTPYLTLSELDNKQTAKAIDIASKAMFYTDTGTVNAIALSRGATTETLETLFDGMVIMFSPANTNTGATTLKIKTLDTKSLKYNGNNIISGYLETGLIYTAVYNATGDYFEIYESNYVKRTNGLIKESLSILGINPDLKFLDSDGANFWLRANGDTFHILVDKDGNGNYDTDETPFVLNNNIKTLVIYGNTVWTSGNDGAGSGLDADKLDGKDSNVLAVANTVPLRDADTAIAGKNQCTAWVNFDGADGTIRSSFNIGSVVRVGTGLYDINFAVDMASADYAMSGTSCYEFDGSDNSLDSQIAPRRLNDNPFTTTKAQICTSYDVTSAYDMKLITVMFFGGK